MDHYRAILEVLKWMHPSDILQGPYFVTKKWVEACNSDELWSEFLPAGSISQDKPLKQLYFLSFTHFLFVALPDKLLNFDLTTHEWQEKPLSRRIAVDTNCTMTLAGLDYVLVLGLNLNTENTIRVQISTGRVETAPLMTPNRRWMGTISCYGRTYAFCGCTSEATQYCNAIGHKSIEWTKLVKAGQKRYSFNPCEKGGLIYLLGGNSAKVPGEVFSVALGTFSPLPYTLQVASCVTVVQEDAAFVITKGKLTQKELASGSSRVIAKLSPSLVGDVYSGFSPIIHAGNAYFLHRVFARVVEISLTTGQWQGYWYPGEHTHYRTKK